MQKSFSAHYILSSLVRVPTLSPTGNDFTMYVIHQVRKQDSTQTTPTQIDKGYYNTSALLCSNTIKTVQPPIRTGSQNLGTAHDHGQAFCRCCTVAQTTGTGKTILISTQLICCSENQSILYTGYIPLSDHVVKSNLSCSSLQCSSGQP